MAPDNNMPLFSKTGRFLTKSVELVLIYFKMPNYEIVREWFPLYTNMWEVQQKLAANINVLPGNIQIKYNGNKLEPWVPLAGLDYEGRMLFIFDVEVFKEPCEEVFGQTPPSITARSVKILSNEDQWLDLTVQVIVEKNKKPSLGGFRNKVTQVEYHHAVTQTSFLSMRRYKVGQLPPRRYTEWTQTPQFYPVAVGTQTRHDHGTQMVKPGLYMPTYNDRVIEPGNYNPFVAKKERILNIGNLNKFKRKCLEIIRRTKEQRIEETRTKMIHMKIEMLRKHSEKVDWDFTISTIFPTNRYGFENLYFLVNCWYEKEKEKLLDASLAPNDPGFKALMVNAFNKKLSLYRHIDVLRTKQRDESLKKQRIQLFNEVSKPKISYYEKGHMTVIETLGMKMFRMLKEVYSGYIRSDYTPEERIEMLLQLKNFVESYLPIELAMPLYELIEREIDMVSMGIKHLTGLRLRITELLYYYFTLDVLEKQNIEEDEKKEHTVDKIRCISCDKLKQKQAFCLRRRYESRYCKPCLWLRNRNTGAPPLGQPKFMLEELRKMNPDNFVLNIIEPLDILILMNKIWNGRSPLSGESDPHKLWLAKWDPTEEWLPWNCILLSKDEAEIHEGIRDIENLYHHGFVFESKRKNVQAKREFKEIYHRYLKLQGEPQPDAIEVPEEKMKQFLNQGDPFFNKAVINVRRRQQMRTDK